MISDLIEFFENATLPKGEVALDEANIICDCKLMVKTHIRALKENPNNRTFVPYYDRLLKLKYHIENVSG